MTTRRLLRGMTWRGAVWNAKVGTISLLILAIINFTVLAIHPCLLNEICDANDYQYDFFDMGYMMTLATPFALGLGYLALFVMGSINGLISGFVTQQFFSRQESYPSCSRLLAIIGVLIALAEGLVSYPLLHEVLWISDYQLIRLIGGLMSSDEVLLLENFAWMLLLVFCAIHVSKTLARWYQRESTKGIAQNVSVN